MQVHPLWLDGHSRNDTPTMPKVWRGCRKAKGTLMTIEVISPAYAIGDVVQTTDTYHIGTITRLYPASSVPMWYGARRLVHTHCYEIQTAHGMLWGLVDALLVKMEAN